MMMRKRIVICADGTWNRPEEDLAKDVPTNVLKLARAIAPIAADGVPQQVFYDWGVGSYHDKVSGGATGKGLNKNVVDDYRYIVQNFQEGDELCFFGFSRGAYTIRALCGLINNCGIIKRDDANLINEAFKLYKRSGKAYKPGGDKAVAFRDKYSYESRQIKFVGVWDTVGSMGIPFSFLGLFKTSDEFYDTKIGGNISYARHALAIDECRTDFEPTVWIERESVDMQQMWFCGGHGNIGGGTKADKDTGYMLSDTALAWMVQEAQSVGVSVESHLLGDLNESPVADMHYKRRSIYRARPIYVRPLKYKYAKTLIHPSVKERWDQDSSYRPKNLQAYLDEHGWT